MRSKCPGAESVFEHYLHCGAHDQREGLMTWGDAPASGKKKASRTGSQMHLQSEA